MEHLTRRRRPGQRGLSLLYALLALAALALSATALVRSVNTGSMVAGNIGFKMDATAAADQTVSKVVAALYAKLSADATSLNADGAITGYYASTHALADVTGTQLSANTGRKMVDWQNTCDGSTVGTCSYTPAASSAAVNGNTAQYVVFRMCSAAGNPATDSTVSCAVPLASSATTSMYRGAVGVGGGSSLRGTDNSYTPYYRIVVRVAGARNTVSFTETIVHF